MKIKLALILYILISIIGIVLLFQIKIPMCYNIYEEAPITFITYNESIIAQVKQEIRENPFYYLKISGNSMQPSIKNSDMCVCTPKQDYNKGEIISFYVPVGNNQVELIIHRIVEENNNQFLTKGDNNEIKDSWILDREQVFCQVPEKTLFDKFRFAILESEGRFSVFSIFG